MYVGTHYNSYYNSLYSANSKVAYGNANSRINNSLLAGLQNAGIINNSSVYNGAAKYVQDIKSGSADLKNALNKLSSGAAFRQKTAVSSDAEAMSIKVADGKYNTYQPKTTVKIDQVATGQVNEGKAINSKEPAGDPGLKQFEVEVNGKKTQLSIEVSASDTNKDVQQKMAEAINAKNLGITASVSMDEDNNTTLSVQSTTTGADSKNSFTLRDISGGLVAKTGVGETTQAAQDAVYSVNGKQYTSRTNEVNLGNGITATLKKAGDKEIEISTGTDKNAAVNYVKDMVDGYNKLYTAAMNNADSDKKAERLFDQLLGNTKTYMNALSKVGIGFDANGKMVVDEKKLGEAAADDSLQRFFVDSSSGNYGFASQLNKIASDVNRSPLNYVDKSTMNSSSFVDNSFYYGSSLNALSMKNHNFLNSGISFDFLL